MTSAPVIDSAAVEAEAAARVAQLTPGQLQCLQLVSSHLSSKEIGLTLGISRHTVDQRIRMALHVLGVERRSQAARLVEHYGGEGLTTIPVSRAPGSARQQGRMLPSWSAIKWPVATRTRPRNEMGITQRLFWIVIIAMGAALSAGMYLAGLESLARMLRG